MTSETAPSFTVGVAKPLVIVESPAKARTIESFLGGDYTVLSSVGHVRDLKSKGLAVDVDNHFKPDYEVHASKKDVIRELRAALKDASELYLATDEDREGEAISWHLLEILKPQVPVRRMVFHEITRGAIEHAVENWRDIDYGLVDAQETRRIVDRLFGYPVSGLLWRKVNQGLSAGRVQSPAVRLVVERERERMAFVAAGYWDLEAEFATVPGFTARLVQVDGAKVATGKDFDDLGRPKSADIAVLDEPTARDLLTRLDGATFGVNSTETKPYRSRPKPPFMTSTLQQEGGRKLRMSASQVMRVAQGLYENGYITYMRTDSVTLSGTAMNAARSQVTELYGAEYLHESPRVYTSKSKNAQEAHEAIRPAGETFRTPAQVEGELNTQQRAVYELIWKRTVASQMADATGQTVSVRVGAEAVPSSNAPDAPRVTEWAASGRTITFPGYLRAYVEGSDDPEAELDDSESLLPPLTEGDQLPDPAIESKDHSTQPPARYTEASLVKRLEELGVGRPSTYASIMQTIQDRGYVWKKGTALVPSWTAFAVVNMLEAQFHDLVDYEFTARMEDDLDQIAAGDKEREAWLHSFWFGNGQPGLSQLVDEGMERIDAAEINTIIQWADDHGEKIVVKPGRYGPYVKRGEDTASIPDDLTPDELTREKAIELLDAPKGDEPIGNHPDLGLPVFVKNGRFGPYVQLGEHDDLPEGWEKPKMESLFKDMTIEGTTLEDALKLLELPREVGVDPESGEVIVALNGRYGPYLSKGEGKGSDSRSLEREQQLFDVTLDEALALFKEPKRRRGQAAQTVLKELGDDPVSGEKMVVKDGRFGPYVTDGEYNASLRKGDEVETLTDERAIELLQMRRDKGPAKKAKKKKAAAKKKPAKKGARKKAAAKKKPAKTAARKKAAANDVESSEPVAEAESER